MRDMVGLMAWWAWHAIRVELRGDTGKGFVTFDYGSR